MGARVCRRLLNTWGRLGRVVGVVVGVVLGGSLLAGCQTSVDVAVKQNLNGSGEVRVALALDNEAAAQAGDLQRTLRLNDLQAAGWRVIGPTPGAGGTVSLQVVKAFQNAGEANLVMAELSGQDGIFSRLVVERNRSPVRVSFSVQGDIDFTKGYETFGDDAIGRAMLSSSQIGLDPQLIQDRYGKPLDQLLPLTFTVELPGTVPKTYQLVPGQVSKVSSSSGRWNLMVLAPIGVFAFGLLYFMARLRARRRRSDERT